MVFGNHGGIHIENAEVRNVSALTLVAGNLALTNHGMGYGVDQGGVSLTQMVIPEDTQLKTLYLAGKEVL